MTGQNQNIYVHNFQNIRSVDGNGTFLDEWDGIEIDYNPGPNGQTSIPPVFIYTQHTYDNDPSGLTITANILPIDTIAMSKVADGDHTIKITGDTYIYDTHHNNANNLQPSWANLTDKDLDPEHTRGLDGGGLAVNAVLIGGAGADRFTYYGGGRAILIGGAGNNYLEGGIEEYGAEIPSNLYQVPLLMRIPSDVNTELQSQVRSIFAPPIVGSNILIGTPYNDLMVGGDGTNEFDGAGGSDSEYGGIGDDQFRADASYTGAAQIYGGGGNNTLTITAIADTMSFIHSPDDNVDVRVQTDPSTSDLDINGKQTVDIAVIGGPQIQARQMKTLGITSYGGRFRSRISATPVYKPWRSIAPRRPPATGSPARASMSACMVWPTVSTTSI